MGAYHFSVIFWSGSHSGALGLAILLAPNSSPGYRPTGYSWCGSTIELKAWL